MTEKEEGDRKDKNLAKKREDNVSHCSGLDRKSEYLKIDLETNTMAILEKAYE